MRYRQLYLQDNYPVFQNRMYPTALAARGCRRERSSSSRTAALAWFTTSRSIRR